MKKLNILLADDHVMLREGLRLLVNAQPDMAVVGEADSGRGACQMVRELNPDVVVMDISLPELTGVQATARLRAECPEVKVLMLTRHDDRGYLKQAVQAGASGYVLKRAASDELIRAIRSVAAGTSYLDPSLGGCLLRDYARRSTPEPADESVLSSRETEVLRLTAWGYSNKEISAELNISVKTVETHKAHVMEKLALRSRADLVRYALRHGWLHE